MVLGLTGPWVPYSIHTWVAWQGRWAVRPHSLGPFLHGCEVSVSGLLSSDWAHGCPRRGGCWLLGFWGPFCLLLIPEGDPLVAPPQHPLLNTTYVRPVPYILHAHTNSHAYSKMAIREGESGHPCLVPL